MKRITFILLTLIVLFGGFLRLYKVSQIPPGLYMDEVSIGVNAYDILTQGKDQNGVAYPLAFATFGEYKLPVYIYSTAISMAIFGKNTLAIRFPSALTGTLTILVLFFLIRELFLTDKTLKPHAEKAALLGALLLAVTPWHVHFSRGGFEATEALFFYVCAVYGGLLFYRKKRVGYILLTSLALIIAFYTYDAYRLIVPITASIGLISFSLKKEYRKKAFLAAIVMLVLAMPLVFFSFFQGGLARLSQTSAFIENPYKTGYEKYLGDIAMYVHNYLSYFSITYLFRFGDTINRHQVNNLGILYLWQIPLLIAGFYFISRTKNALLRNLLILLLLLGPIPASLARPSPHTLRNLFSVVPWTIITIVGLYQLLLQKGKWMKCFLVILGIFALIEGAYYFHYYYIHYPQEAIIDWGGGCKTLMQEIQKDKASYQHIVVDKNIKCLSDYFTFYIPHVPLIYVPVTWTKPYTWGRTLYVRPFYGSKNPPGLVTNITIPNLNHDIVAQLIQL